MTLSGHAVSFLGTEGLPWWQYRAEEVAAVAEDACSDKRGSLEEVGVLGGRMRSVLGIGGRGSYTSRLDSAHTVAVVRRCEQCADLS